MYRNSWNIHPQPRRRNSTRRMPGYRRPSTIEDMINTAQSASTRTKIPVKTTQRREQHPTANGPIDDYVANTTSTTQSIDIQAAQSVASSPTLDTGKTRDTIDSITPEDVDWKAVAKRSQAEMDGFKQRQKRRADAEIAAEQERLLKTFLPVVDNLRRALDFADNGDASMQEGVELVHRQLVRLLEAEGVTRIDTANQPFDPELHEAIALAPTTMPSGHIVDEVEAGFRLNDKLLRPARVVVAE